MPLGTPLAAVNTSGSVSVSSITVTIPAGASIGDPAWLIAHESTGVNTMTTPAGWTLVDGPQDVGDSSQRAYLFTRTLASGDPGSTVTVQWSGSGRIAAAITTVTGASGQDARVQWTDATADLTLTIPAITPVAAGCLELALVCDRFAAGAATGVTPNAAWTEIADTATTNTTNPKLGAWVGYRQLSGQAGVAQPSYDNTYASIGRNIGWVLTVAPTATSTTYQASGAAAGSSGVAAAVTAVLLAAGTVAGASGVSGSATVAPRMYAASGSVAATSTATGDATRVLRTLDASGTVTATSGTTGDATRVALTLAASGAVTATSSTSGDTTRVLRTLAASGTVPATSTTAGAVSVLGGPQTYPAAGTVVAVTTSSGTVQARLTVGGANSATSTTTGDVTATLTAAGTVEGTSGSTGDTRVIAAPVTYQAAGTVDATSDVTGNVTATSPSDATPVDNPALTIANHDRTLTITTPGPALTVNGHDRTLTLTTPPSTLELQ